jgi:hypothetical protein
MATVICDMSMSLDGYVTGPNDSRENPFGDGAGMLHDWFSSDAATNDDQAILREMVDGLGAVRDRTQVVRQERGRWWLGRGGPLALVDQIRLHVVAVLLGAGTPLFGALAPPITLERAHALITPAATHIGFRVIR